MFKNRLKQKCIDELLVLASIDWIYAADVASVVLERGYPVGNEKNRQLSLDIIRELLTQGLMRPGLVTENGFIAWTLPTIQAIRKIEEEWGRLGRRGPEISEICWFELTKEGFRRAHELSPPEVPS